ncbi:MAG: ParA family partition ATPase [Geminicoccaceae bacterium]|nr:ParA family protein [Geminicoccaceae bacterium]MDW8125541.1 ParA family partition ATPase [Geminicoccaceae bacterium]MDW8342802.1 ParA family partition ATPase [Geminicoccaceae bacterium]
MPARIVTVAQQKGGAGKTTLVVQLATACAARGFGVAIVDIDPQATLAHWMRLREQGARGVRELRFSMVGGWRLGVELDRLLRDVELVFVDTPPHAESEAKGAIRRADLVLVPAQPSPPDLWASAATFDLARKEGRPARLVWTRVPPRGRAVEEAGAEAARRGWPALSAVLGNRRSYVASFARGLGVIEAEPRSAAAAEVEALVGELEGWLRG